MAAANLTAMKNLTTHLNALLAEAFAAAGLEAQHATVVASGRPELADYQCNGALALAKPLGKNPRELAEVILKNLEAQNTHKAVFSELSIAGPGFINLKLTDTFLASHAQGLLSSPTLGFAKTQNPDTIILDYAGPNMGKPMHVGHLRPTIIGESLKRMLRFAGHHAQGDVHFGDWGMPMGMIIAEIEHDHPHLPFFEAGKTKGFPTESPVDIDQIGAIYRKAAARGKENEEVRQKARLTAAALQEGHAGYMALWRLLREVSFASAKENFLHLNATFELWLGESDVRDMLSPMVAGLKAKNIAVLDEGAIIVRYPDEAKLPPMMLEKSDGGYTYATTDLATIKMRTEIYNTNRILYIVDRRQSLHFQQVFAGARMAGYADYEMRHIPFGTINGADGTPLKSREGLPVKLEDIIKSATEKALEKLPLPNTPKAEGLSEDELLSLAKKIGIAAIKFQDLQNNLNTDYVFDLEQFSRFEGKTGPYLQYSVARINSIFEKAGLAAAYKGSPISITHPAERSLILAIANFADAFGRAVDRYEPNALCEQAFTVAQKFSAFYNDCPILSEADEAIKNSRLTLAALTRVHQLICLDLLGIDAPHKMLTR